MQGDANSYTGLYFNLSVLRSLHNSIIQEYITTSICLEKSSRLQ